MPRVKTLSFVAEFPLQTTAADEKTLDTRLNAARHLYNACLQECLHRLDLMKQSKAWQAARAMPATVDKRHNKARSQAFGPNLSGSASPRARLKSMRSPAAMPAGSAITSAATTRKPRV